MFSFEFVDVRMARFGTLDPFDYTDVLKDAENDDDDNKTQTDFEKCQRRELKHSPTIDHSDENTA